MTSSDIHPEPPPAHDEHSHPKVRGGLALWTLCLGFAMLMVGNGLNAAVVGVRTVDEGFGVRTTGVVMACFFVGFLLGPPAVLRMLSTVGHIRVFASRASTASCVVLVHFVWISPLSWGAMRMVFGFCMAGLFVVVESWLNDASTPATHGLIACYVAYRLLVADGLPMDRQGEFVPVPARATELAIGLTARPLKASRARLRPPAGTSRDVSGSDPTGFISGRRW